MLNAPLLEVQRKWRDINASIPAAVKAHEDRLDADIKSVEAVREAEKQRKIQVERDRINGLRAKITAVASLPAAAAKAMTSSDITHIQTNLANNALDEET
jgi:predicted component of type VI protein secretion system